MNKAHYSLYHVAMKQQNFKQVVPIPPAKKKEFMTIIHEQLIELARDIRLLPPPPVKLKEQ